MEALIYFALWAGLIFLMMRAGCGAHVAGNGQGDAAGRGCGAKDARPRWRPPEKDTDPVCGKVVRTATAKPSLHDGKVYFFCSRDCREIFEAAPEYYLRGHGGNHETVEHSHA